MKETQTDPREGAAIAAELRKIAGDVERLGSRVGLDKRRERASSAAAAIRRLAGNCEQPRGIGELLAKLDRRLDAGQAGGDGVTPPDGYRPDAKGRLVPERLVREEDKLEDQTVRRIVAFGVDLADQVARFRAHCYADVAALLDLLTEKYGGGRRPGRRGNYSITSFDGRLRVVVQVQDRVAFGPQLQAARRLINECITEWAEGTRAEIRALVQLAFEPDKIGNVNREAVFRLRRLDIDDERWRGAQRAIDDSIRIDGTRAYLRLYWRSDPEARFEPVPIDMASSWRDPECQEQPLSR